MSKFEVACEKKIIFSLFTKIYVTFLPVNTSHFIYLQQIVD
jgi:hypothetical protein